MRRTKLPSPFDAPFSLTPLLPDGLAYGNASRLKIVKAENIYSEIVRRDALAMKRIDPADLTEEVTRGLSVELVLRRKLMSGDLISKISRPAWHIDA